MEHHTWLRCIGEFPLMGARGSAEVLACRRAGVRHRRRSGGKQADNPGRQNGRSQQGRRHRRKSPRVDHPSLPSEPDCTALRTPLIVGTRNSRRNGRNGLALGFSRMCCLDATVGGCPCPRPMDGDRYRGSAHRPTSAHAFRLACRCSSLIAGQTQFGQNVMYSLRKVHLRATFLLHRLSYMRDFRRDRSDNPKGELAWAAAAVSSFKIDSTLDRRGADGHFDRGYHANST